MILICSIINSYYGQIDSESLSDGPGSNKLLNGDEILAVNDEDVEFASRNYLLVKQPTPKSNNSLLLTEDKKALKKEINSNKKVKVRFRLEDNGKELIKCDEEILNEELIEKETIKIDLNLEISEPIFKVSLENQNVKSFKYDKNTTVKDVLQCLKEKLSIKTMDYFGLVIRLSNEFDCVSKYILIDEMQHLFSIREKFGQNFICMLRFVFIPSNYQELSAFDENALSYLYEQSVNDVLKEKYASEIKYEMILHLTTLGILYDLYDVLPDFYSNNFELDIFFKQKIKGLILINQFQIGNHLTFYSN
ncbi:FERM and PDZ domain-containing 4-like isoform X1 [Brachionus plicatilis]|uniref:FERM and PDZ domain-containing 4-like isoform X1 n=1 Tax=Brachionus plicatilis TaxID=10195 RepID=A0A3M7QDB3_BRAPC|nr:FERM and PDZ domain-containing 4-like isoform X1 [Brachionus plicatilis]